MEAHPVPQNVTSFEFRLVGDMTLKQFLYLASGVGLAYLIFVTIAARYPFVAWPLIIIFSLLGIAYAFVPIQDRPLDHWTGAFLKAIYAPTKRMWRKNGKDMTQDIVFKNRLHIFLTAAAAPPPRPSFALPPIPQSAPLPQQTSVPPTPLHPIQPATPPQAPIQTPVHPIPQQPVITPLPQVAPEPIKQPSPSIMQPAAHAPAPAPITHHSSVRAEPLPTPKELDKTVELGRQAQTLQLRIIETERQLAQIKKKAAENKENPAQLTTQFNQIFESLQKLTEEASGVKQQLSTLTKQPMSPIEPVKIEIVPPSKPKQTQMVLTSVPNVINGIVTDQSGNYLEAVVVVIHDKDGLPVRALKTNKLGQFTGSTPLLNGTYTIELEKDGFTFDVLKIELDGKVLPALMIAAKTAAQA